MTQYAVGPRYSQVWAGQGPVLLANQDLLNPVTIGDQPNVTLGSQAADLIPALGSIGYAGGRRLYAIAPAGTAALLVVAGGTTWAPSPAQVALQIQALGLAKDVTVQATNSQLVAGVPPAVTGLAAGAKILQSPGTYTLYTFASAGRIWAANVSYAMGCTGGSGSQQGYAQVMVQGGAPLAIVEACVAGGVANDSNTDSQTFPGFSVNSGTVVQLDVNNGGSVTGGVNRGSGLVVVSIP